MLLRGSSNPCAKWSWMRSSQLVRGFLAAPARWPRCTTLQRKKVIFCLCRHDSTKRLRYLLLFFLKMYLFIFLKVVFHTYRGGKPEVLSIQSRADFELVKEKGECSVRYLGSGTKEIYQDNCQIFFFFCCRWRGRSLP